MPALASVAAIARHASNWQPWPRRAAGAIGQAEPANATSNTRAPSEACACPPGQGSFRPPHPARGGRSAGYQRVSTSKNVVSRFQKGYGADMIVLEFKSRNFLSYRQMVRSLGNEKWKVEAFRAVQDAGKKARTRTQRAVTRQMALKPGNYQSYVVAGTGSFSKRKDLSFTMFGTRKGTRIENYKGLRALSSKGRVAKRYNEGRSGDKGLILSEVWNNPRVFKRSFMTPNGYFARLPGSNDDNSAEPKRGPDGRFQKTRGSKRRSRPRRLYGPSLKKEYVQGPALETFMDLAPMYLEQNIKKRAARILKF